MHFFLFTFVRDLYETQERKQCIRRSFPLQDVQIRRPSEAARDGSVERVRGRRHVLL